MPHSEKKHHHLSWREAEEGRWSRHLTGIEHWLWLMSTSSIKVADGRENDFPGTCIKLNRKDGRQISTESIRTAWIRLRYAQPGIATTIDPADWTLNYSVPNADELQRWVDQSFFVHEDTSLEELYPDLPAVHNAALHWLPSSSEVLLRAPHWKIDGRGLLLSLAAFCEALQQPDEEIVWGKEVLNLSKTSSEVWDLNPSATEEEIQQADAMLGAFGKNFPGIGPAIRDGSPGQCQYTTCKLDKNTTKRFIAACKARGMTVSKALVTANILAMKAHSDPKDRDKDYASMGLYDLRTYLDPSYYTTSHAFNLYMWPLPIITTVGSFEETYKSIEDQYSKYMADLKGNQSARQTYEYYTQRFTQLAQEHNLFSGSVQPSDPFVSSLGIIEDYLPCDQGDYEVIDIDALCDIVLRPNILEVFTFKDQLKFNYCYNAINQSRAEVQSILNTIVQILKDEMGL